MDQYQSAFINPGLRGRCVTHPNLTKYVQSSSGGSVTRPSTREMRRAAERFHRKQSKKNK